MKRQRITPGAIVKIVFDSDRHTYGRLLVRPFVQIYDAARVDDASELSGVLSQPTLFTVGVYDWAIKKGRWLVVGRTDFNEENEPIHEEFIEDKGFPPKYRIIDWFGSARSASLAECRKLQRCAVWEPEHIEERIRDHYAGRPNKWLESLRLQT